MKVFSTALSALLLASAASWTGATLLRKFEPPQPAATAPAGSSAANASPPIPKNAMTRETRGKGKSEECLGEPGGGVHVCSLESAHSKCGTKGKDRDDPRYRHVVCCCHSDTCHSACCETSLTDVCGGNLDDALAEDGVTILNQTMYV